MQHFDEASNPPHEHLVKYIKKPLTILRISALVFSVIVFGCISSEGWHYDPAAGTRVCSVNSSYGTCQLAVTVAVLALLLGAALMAAEWFYDALPSSDVRKQLVVADLVFSAVFALLFLITFSTLAHQWSLSKEPWGHFGHSNIEASITFSFFSIFVWGLSSALAFRRLQLGVDAELEASLLVGRGPSSYTEFGSMPGTGGGYQDIGGYTGGGPEQPRPGGGASSQYRSQHVQPPFAVQDTEPPFSQQQSKEELRYQELHY